MAGESLAEMLEQNVEQIVAMIFVSEPVLFSELDERQ